MAEAGVGTDSGRYKEAEAAVPEDHSTSLVVAMMDKAVAVVGPEEGMVVAPVHEVLGHEAPGHEVLGHEVLGHEVRGTGEVDHRVGQSSQVLIARAVCSMVFVGEDEMDYEFLVEEANL